MLALRTLAFAASLSAALSAQLAGSFYELPHDIGAPDYPGIKFQYYDTDPDGNTDLSGVAVTDYNNDGWYDIFFPNNRGRPNRLYENQGDGTFVDVAGAKGVSDSSSASASGLFLDYDNDGDVDLFVSSHMGSAEDPHGPMAKLFRNGGAAEGYVFTDVTADADFGLGVTPEDSVVGWMGGTCVGDFNVDGYPDLFVCWWMPAGADQDGWRLFESVANPTPGDPNDPSYTPRVFVDATPGSGLDEAVVGQAWQAQWADLNRDGLPDLHVNRDFFPDKLYVNNGDGTFTNMATAVGMNGKPEEGRNEMGSAMGDFDNDGDLDFHMTNVGNKDRFYRNDTFKGVLSFNDIARPTQLNKSIFGWGTSFFDVDNDGDLDHAAVSGFEHNLTQPYFNRLQLNMWPATDNTGKNIKWLDVSHLVPAYSKMDTTFGDPARGLATIDFDNDGDIDLLVTRNNEEATLVRNDLSSPHGWLKVDLRNTGGSLNTVGSQLYLRGNGYTQYREVVIGSSYLCQEPLTVHFGVRATRPDGASADAPVSKGGISGPSSGPVQGGGDMGGSATASQGGAVDWLVVRWPDGELQIVTDLTKKSVNEVLRDGLDATGDMDGDGSLTATDQLMLLVLSTDPLLYDALYPDTPGLVTGDVNGDNVVDGDDYALWPSL